MSSASDIHRGNRGFRILFTIPGNVNVGSAGMACGRKIRLFNHCRTKIKAGTPTILKWWSRKAVKNRGAFLIAWLDLPIQSSEDVSSSNCPFPVDSDPESGPYACSAGSSTYVSKSNSSGTGEACPVKQNTAAAIDNPAFRILCVWGGVKKPRI